MKVSFRNDSVIIEGYVNAVERESKPLYSRIGQFIERIKQGAFTKALKRNDDVKILLNHDPDRELGSTKRGNLELSEDNIGLKARAEITDADVIKKARNNELVGWSFGFYDRSVIERIIDGVLHRDVEDLDLEEVSILDNTKEPAYSGTLIMARAEDGKVQFRSEPLYDAIEQDEETTDEPSEETQEEPNEATETTEAPDDESEPKQQDVVEIDYSVHDNFIKENKEEM